MSGWNQVHGAEKATLERQTEALETQLSSARNDIKHQVLVHPDTRARSGSLAEN